MILLSVSDADRQFNKTAVSTRNKRYRNVDMAVELALTKIGINPSHTQINVPKCISLPDGSNIMIVFVNTVG